MRAFTLRHFTLTSGRTSDYYVDGKQVTLDGRGLYLVARFALEHCREHGIDAIGGLTLGADPIAAATAALSGEPTIPSPRSSCARRSRRTGRAAPSRDRTCTPGMRVLLVDDTMTTGGTFLQAQEAVVATGATIVGALCVVDREEGGREALEAAGITLHALFQRSEFSPRKSPA